MNGWMPMPDGPGDFWYAVKGEPASLCVVRVVRRRKCEDCKGTGRIPEVRHPPYTLMWTTESDDKSPGTNVKERVVPEHKCEYCRGKGVIAKHFIASDGVDDFIVGRGRRWMRAEIPVAG